MEKAPHFSQVQEQQVAGKQPTVLIERSSGEIQTARLMGLNRDGHEGVEFGDNKAKLIPEHKLSDEYQQELANQLAVSAGRSAEEWDRINLPSHEEEDNSEAERILEELSDAMRSFHTKHADRITSQLSRYGSYDQTLGECEGLVRTFMYGDMPKQEFIARAQDLLTPLQGALMQDSYDGEDLRRSTRQLQGVIEETSHSVTRNQDLPDEMRRVVRKMEEAVGEIDTRARIINQTDEEAVFTVRKALEVLNELSYDNWGSETNAAHLSSLLSYSGNGLGSILEDGRRSLILMQSEFDSMK